MLRPLRNAGINRIIAAVTRAAGATEGATPAAILAYAVDFYVDAIVTDLRGLRARFAY